MYIVYTMIIYHVLIKVFSFNSGVMLKSSFSDALLLENVFVIRLNILNKKRNLTLFIFLSFLGF